MQGQSNSTTQAIEVQPTETQGQTLRPAPGLKVKTNVKAGQGITGMAGGLPLFNSVLSHVKAGQRVAESGAEDSGGLGMPLW